MNVVSSWRNPSSDHPHSEQGLDSSAFVHGVIRLDNAFEVGLKVEDATGIDAAVQDVVE